MIYGHADLLATLGRCADDPACTRPPVTVDDDGVRRCARHAMDHLTQEPAR